MPIALKDVIGTEGIETTAGSKILGGYIPVYDATVAARCQGRRADAARQDEHRRVRDGLVDRELGVRPDAQPVGPDARAGRLGRRVGRRGRRRARAVGARLRHRRLDQQPAALCGIVGLRPTYGTVSRYGLVAFASSLDQVGPSTKTVRDCALLYRDHRRARPARLDHRRVARTGADSPTAGGRVDGRARRRADGAERRRGNRAGRARGGARARSTCCVELGRRRSSECSLPRSVEYGSPCYYLIAPAEASSNLARYDGVRYGLRADGADLTDDVRAHARRRIRRRGRSGASCSAPTRCRPATTTRTTARRRRCAR